MTSLTKKSLFEQCKLDITEHTIEGWGTVHIKTMSELNRSTRIANMFDDKGELKDSAKVRQRANMLVDHLCEKDGKPMFTEGDVKDLLSLDAKKLDDICGHIADIIEGKEGNEQAE